MKRLVALAPLLLSASLLGACGDDGGASSAEPPPAPPPNQPPHVTSIDVPEWPPLGPGDVVRASCTDKEGQLNRATAIFASTRSTMMTGASAEAVFQTESLGEGMGTLRIVCCDMQNVCAERNVRNLVVDLSPPEIEPDRLIASPTGEDFDGEIAVWVRDSWVLGTVELSYNGKTLRHELPKAYPATIGQKSDITRVAFKAKELGEGTGDALVVAIDAAGNKTTRKLPLRVDGRAPVVSIVEPAPNAIVTGQALTIELAATDGDNPTPPTIDLYIGGALVGQVNGPSSRIVLDTSTLSRGITEIRAVARDDAGNQSPWAKVPVELR